MAVATAEATPLVEAAAAEEVKEVQDCVSSGTERQPEASKADEKRLVNIVKEVGADLASFGKDILSAWSFPAPVVEDNASTGTVKEKKATEIVKDVGHDLALLAKDVYDAWHEASPVSTIYNSLMTPFRGRLVLAEKRENVAPTGTEGKTEAAAPASTGKELDASKPKAAEATAPVVAGSAKDDEFDL